MAIRNRKAGNVVTSTELTVSDLVINSGEVSENEVPLWVGPSKVKGKDSKPLLTSISLERDWLWIRFVVAPHAEYRKWLFTHGFIWSGKREGYHLPASVQSVELLIKMGAVALDTPAILKVSTEMVDGWKVQQEAKQEARRKAEYARMGSGRTTIDHKGTTKAKAEIRQANREAGEARVNKAGRLVDSNGRFISTQAMTGIELPDLQAAEESGHISIGERVAPAKTVSPMLAAMQELMAAQQLQQEAMMKLIAAIAQG